MLVQLDRSDPAPLYLQISGQIRELILTGALPEGSRLPPQRELASMLGVNRTTVVSAYQELAADGLVDATIGRGTVVRATVHPTPSVSPSPLPWAEVFSLRTRATCDPLIRDMMTLCARQDVISFAAGVPAPDLYPLDDFRAVVDEVLARDGRTLLQHCPTEGYFPLREWLAGRMAERGAHVSARNVLVLAGSQQGLDLVARLLLDPGDVVIDRGSRGLHGGASPVSRLAGLLYPQVKPGFLRLPRFLRHQPRLRRVRGGKPHWPATHPPARTDRFPQGVPAYRGSDEQLRAPAASVAKRVVIRLYRK